MCQAEWCYWGDTCTYCQYILNNLTFGMPVLCAMCATEFNKIDHKKEFLEELDMDWDFE